jgi:uncharacterized protein (TIGR02147 family)
VVLKVYIWVMSDTNAHFMNDPSTGEVERPSIFDYLDYRIFLNDYYDWKKRNSNNFSYRLFGKMAGVSASLFKDIVSERQNLSPKIVEKYATAMNLRKRERVYFTHLVLFNNAKSNTEKNEHFENMISIRRQRKNTILDVSKFDYFAEWYHSVVRELVHNQPTDTLPITIGEKICPKISGLKVKRSIQLLLSLDLICCKEIEGVEYWVQTNRSISSDFDARSQALKKYQSSMIQLAQESIERFDGNQRNLQAMTLSGSAEAYEKIKKLMNQFVNEAFNILEADGQEIEKVFALTLQMFPLATPKGEHYHD